MKQSMEYLIRETRNYAEQKIAEYLSQKSKPEEGITQLADDIVTYVEKNSHPINNPFPIDSHEEPLLKDVIRSGIACSKSIVCPWCGHFHDPSNTQLNELGEGVSEHICRRCDLPYMVTIQNEKLFRTKRF